MAGDLEDRIDRRMQRTVGVIETEIRRTSREARAFQNFAKNVRELNLSHASNVTGGPMVQTMAVNTPGTRNRLRTVYETTVMAVPHYEADYGDSFEDSFIAEFGPSLARAIMKGPSLDGRQKKLLLAKARESRHDRLQLLEILDTERESVRTQSEQLRNLTAEMETLHDETASAATFGGYDAIRSRLITIVSQCETLLASRQETLNTQRKDLSLPVEAPDVPSYMYEDLEITYPLLASIADILSAARALRSRVERGMAYAN